MEGKKDPSLLTAGEREDAVRPSVALNAVLLRFSSDRESDKQTEPVPGP